MGGEKTRISVEITPEMIEAGREKLYNFDIMHPVENEMNEAVKAVFVSMFESLPQSR